MKFSTIITSLLLAACSANQPALLTHQNTMPTPTTTLKRVWILTYLSGFTQKQLIAANAQMDWTQLPHSSANMGCNNLMFESKINDKTHISFSSIAATRMYCPKAMKLEQDFMQTLSQMTHYTIQGHQLILSNDHGDKIEFIAQDFD